MGLALTVPSQASQGASALVQTWLDVGSAPRQAGLLFSVVSLPSLHWRLSGSVSVLSPCLVSEASSSPVPLCFCDPGLTSAMTICSELVIPVVSLLICAQISERKPPPKALCPKSRGPQSCLHRSHVDSAVVDSAPLGLDVGWGWDTGETREVSSNQWPCWSSGQLAMQVSAPGDPCCLRAWDLP